MTDFLQHFAGLLFFVLWVISTVGNGLVIYIFLKWEIQVYFCISKLQRCLSKCRVKSLRSPSNMLVVSLVCLIFFPN